MAREKRRIFPDSLTLKARELSIDIQRKKEEIIKHGSIMVNIASVFSSAFISVFLAFAIDRTAKTPWILLLVAVSLVYLLIIYYFDIYFYREPISL